MILMDIVFKNSLLQTDKIENEIANKEDRTWKRKILEKNGYEI